MGCCSVVAGSSKAVGAVVVLVVMAYLILSLPPQEQLDPMVSHISE
jgi:hypothetical protein